MNGFEGLALANKDYVADQYRRWKEDPRAVDESWRMFFAVATNRSDPGAFRPVGEGDSAEAALDACLTGAGIYHRRRVKQAGG